MRGMLRSCLSGTGIISLTALLVIISIPCSGIAAPLMHHELPAWQPAVFTDFPVRLELSSRDQLDRLLAKVPIASFEREQIRATDDGLVFTPRITEEEAGALTAAGYAFTRLPDREQEGRRAVEAFWAAQETKGYSAPDPDKTLYYPTHAQIGSDFAALASAHPTIARTFTWGTSVQGRELWGIVISDDVQNTEAEPEVRLSSTMHGDEPVDMVMLWAFAQYLVNNYDQPGYEDVTDLVNSTEIHIMPLHNPDGYVADTRSNANGVDLNRNFLEPAGSATTQEPENVAFMNYALAHHFVISQNGHAGALVVNYPWDYTATRAPDDAALIDLSLEYSTYNLPMYNSGSFPQGITNGYDWYPVTGSVQDWSYYVTDCIDVTIEVSNNKWPATSTLDGYWGDNRESLMHFVKAAHYGVHGVVTDADTGQPLEATVTVTGNTKSVHTDPAHGDYYKLLDTGTYELTFSADGYVSRTISGVGTTWGTPTVLNVALTSIGPTVTETLFSSDFENGTAGWTGDWGTASPGHESTSAMNDSPDGDYPSYAGTITTMVAGVDLSDTTIISGEVRFWAQWDIEPDYDACFLEGSTDGGTSWFAVATDHTHLSGGLGVQIPTGTPIFDGIQADWILNTVDLAPVLGQSDLRLRFRLASDGSVNGAGFAFDDFIIEVLKPDTSSRVPGIPQPYPAITAAPNPFNPVTSITFALPEDGDVRVAIYDLQGRLMRNLVSESLPAGRYSRTWDGRDDDGSTVASGVYLAVMTSGNRKIATKLTLVK